MKNALNQKTHDSHSRERIIEWISLAYLWTDENLESALLSKIFAGGADDLQIVADFFWRVRGDKLTSDQMDKILAFWSKSIAWSKAQNVVPVGFLAGLSRLSSYLKSLDERAKSLLLEVVPHLHKDYSTDHMVGELARLADTNPAATAEILERMLQVDAPNYDMDDKLKRLIQKLAKLGFRAEAPQVLAWNVGTLQAACSCGLVGDSAARLL